MTKTVDITTLSRSGLESLLRDSVSGWNAARASAKWWCPNLWRADLRYANLWRADLGDANLRDADLRDADLRSANLGDADLGDADLRDADLRSANLRDANLGGADLGDADLRDADLRSANLRGADLGGADLRGANGEQVKLTGRFIQCGPVGPHAATLFETRAGHVIQAGCATVTIDALEQAAVEEWGADHEHTRVVRDSVVPFLQSILDGWNA